MSFINAGLLGGLVLALLPIIIHLINRRRARLRQFSALEFLLLSDKRLARRLRFKQLLVLALRVALLAFLVFALARPYVEPQEGALGDPGQAGSVVLLIDDSASMHARIDGDETLISRALSRAKRMVHAGGASTSFAVIATGQPARLLTSGLTFDRDEAIQAIERIARGLPSDRGDDAEGALAEAGRILSESQDTRRRMVVFSDRAATAWGLVAANWRWPALQSVHFERLHEGVVPNLSVKDVRVGEPEPAGQDGKQQVQVWVQVKNEGDAPAHGTIELWLEGQVVAELTQLEAGALKELEFVTPWEPGMSRGRVQLKPSDDNRLDRDDAYYFTLGARRPTHVLAVNGAPSSTAYLDELFFVRPALQAIQEGEVPVELKVMTLDGLSERSLVGIDVVILANVALLEASQREALLDFVRAGGGILLSAGDRFLDEDPHHLEEVNASLGELLPWPLHELKSVGDGFDPRAMLAAMNLGVVQEGHPVFRIFDGLEDVSLYKANVMSYLLVRAGGDRPADVIASLSDGSPLLVEAARGRGKVMLFTSTLDRDWSDLALRSSFPVLMQRLVAYLARQPEEGGHGEGIVGQSHVAQLPPGQGPVVLIRPDGSEEVVEDAPEAGVEALTLPALEQVGHHALMRAGERHKQIPFAVNLDPGQSDLRPVEDAHLQKIELAMTTAEGGAVIVAEGEGVPDISDVYQGKMILWPWILAGLFVLFAGEAWLLVRNV